MYRLCRQYARRYLRRVNQLESCSIGFLDFFLGGPAESAELSKVGYSLSSKTAPVPVPVSVPVPVYRTLPLSVK